MIEFEVERPRPVLSSGISYIFEFTSSCSHESVVESFISLDSLESFESFHSIFLPFLLYIKKPKFDLSGSLQKTRNLIALPGYIYSSKKGLEKYENVFVP